MSFRLECVVVVLGSILVVGLAGCSSSARAAISCSDAGAAARPAPFTAPAPILYERVGPRRGRGLCGLPCETGCGDWHVRGGGGYSFHAGEDAGEGCGYLALDVGRTFPCCWGVDLFYRTHGAKFDRDVFVPGAAPFVGSDKGRFHHLGIKGTYERSLGNGRWFWYAGLGAQYFWTADFFVDDEGIGGFGELGVGVLLDRTWRVRLGVDALVQDTEVGRQSRLDDDTSRLLWVIAPVLTVQADF